MTIERRNASNQERNRRAKAAKRVPGTEVCSDLARL